MLICFIICTCHLYDATENNYLYFKKHKDEYLKPTLTETLLQKTGFMKKKSQKKID